MTILERLKDLRDPGVSGEFDQQPITRAELADIIEELIEVMD